MCQPLHAGTTGPQAAVGMRVDSAGQVREGIGVQPIVAVGVELDRLAGDLQKGRVRLTALNGTAQPVQGLAQGVQGLGARLVVPQEIGQHLPAKGHLRMHHQVDEQRPGRGSLEPCDAFSILADLKSTKEGNFESGHGKRSVFVTFL